ATAGQWDRGLLDAALAKVPQHGKGKVEEEDKDALVYRVEYRDGLQAAAYVSPRHVREFAFAGKIKGRSQPSACWYELPKPERNPSSFLGPHAARMMTPGKPSYPVERTLLTGGMLSFLIESKANGHRRIETPQLAVKYEPPEA